MTALTPHATPRFRRLATLTVGSHSVRVVLVLSSFFATGRA